MKKYFFLFLAAFLGLTFAACSDDDEKADEKPGEPQAQSVVGKWSGVTSLEEIGQGDVRMHYNFNADGTFEMIMEAWAQHRLGTYTVSGNQINMEVEKIEWFWNRDNGYMGVLDENGYESFEAWKKDRPEDWYMQATYKFDKDGYLYIENATFGLQLIFFSDPDYVPKKHIY